METTKAGSQAWAEGPSEWFTSHTHPLGQTLIVTAGSGWVQRWGKGIEEIRPGDVVWFSPGEKHWHGATAPHSDDTHDPGKEG